MSTDKMDHQGSLAAQVDPNLEAMLSDIFDEAIQAANANLIQDQINRLSAEDAREQLSAEEKRADMIAA